MLTFRKIKIISIDFILAGLLLLFLAGHYLGIFSSSVDRWLLIVISLAATAPVMLSAVRSLKNKRVSVDLLASVALVMALMNQQWSSAAFVNLMLTLARIFEGYTRDATRRAIQHLLKLRPERVRVERAGAIVFIAVSEIELGERIHVELGERIAADGTVVSGQAQVDQSSLTGESLPLTKGVGDRVLSSTLNVSGSLVIRADRVGQDTIFEKMVKLVEQAQREKPRIETVADRFAGWYITLTFVGAALLYFFSSDLKLVLAVMLVTCADDIAVAIPLAFSVGIAQAAKHGIIVKGGAYLEGLARAKIFILDKTGTLTLGRLKVARIAAKNGFSEAEIVRLAASFHIFSSHPVAQAVVEFAQARKIDLHPIREFKEHSGEGSHAAVDGHKAVTGKLDFLEKEGVVVAASDRAEFERFKQIGRYSIMPVAYDDRIIGFILLEDEVRPETKNSLDRLRLLGAEKIVMLTGDNEKVAANIAKTCGIDEYRAELLPEDKLRHIKGYIRSGRRVVMIGDGVNDAAALAMADVGIAMGAIGSDAAIEAADLALMEDNLSKVPVAYELSQRISRMVRQDFWIWGIVNGIGLVLVLSRILGPEGAAVFNFLGDFIPIFNSLRLFRVRNS